MENHWLYCICKLGSSPSEWGVWTWRIKPNDDKPVDGMAQWGTLFSDKPIWLFTHTHFHLHFTIPLPSPSNPSELLTSPTSGRAYMWARIGVAIPDQLGVPKVRKLHFDGFGLWAFQSPGRMGELVVKNEGGIPLFTTDSMSITSSNIFQYNVTDGATSSINPRYQGLARYGLWPFPILPSESGLAQHGLSGNWLPLLKGQSRLQYPCCNSGSPCIDCVYIPLLNPFVRFPTSNRTRYV